MGWSQNTVSWFAHGLVLWATRKCCSIIRGGSLIQSHVLLTCGQALSLAQTPPFICAEEISLSLQLRCSLGKLTNIFKALLIRTTPCKRKLAYPFNIAVGDGGSVMSWKKCSPRRRTIRFQSWSVMFSITALNASQPWIHHKNAWMFAPTWTDLEMITLNEVNKTEKDKYRMIPLTSGILKNDINELIYKTNRSTDINKLMVTKEQKQEEGNKLGVWD